MSALHLNIPYMKVLKENLRNQCGASSSHITEAIARACGFLTHAALLNDLRHTCGGQFVIFSYTAFWARLTSLNSGVSQIAFNLPPLGADARYVAKLLNDPALRILELRPMLVRFRLASITTEISIRLKYVGEGNFQFLRSHAIHTPLQMDAYWPSRDIDDDAAYALHRAIESIASYYREAVGAGHAPSTQWLITP